MRKNRLTLCRCGHAKHVAQCPAPDGCWCDTYSEVGTLQDMTELFEALDGWMKMDGFSPWERS